MNWIDLIVVVVVGFLAMLVGITRTKSALVKLAEDGELVFIKLEDIDNYSIVIGVTRSLQTEVLYTADDVTNIKLDLTKLADDFDDLSKFL